eukprot:5949837-Pleurochrysis_carterae.AAC.1
MGVEDLRDQLKKHKLLGKTGFALSLPNRTAYVLQQQTLLLEANETGTTSRTATPASTAASCGAAQLSEEGSTGVGCAPTWTTSGPWRRRRHSRWRL